MMRNITNEAPFFDQACAELLAHHLTQSEWQIAHYAMSPDGITSKQIALGLRYSPHTINDYKKSIRQKASKIYGQNVSLNFALSELKCYLIQRRLI